MRKAFTVNVNLPKGCDSVTMAKYIHEAVSRWNLGIGPNTTPTQIESKPLKVEVSHRLGNARHYIDKL